MERNRNGRATPTRNGAAQPEGRAKQRAFTIGALETGDDLSELHELLRTAGVAVVGPGGPAPRQAAPEHATWVPARSPR